MRNHVSGADRKVDQANVRRSPVDLRKQSIVIKCRESTALSDGNKPATELIRGLRWGRFFPADVLEAILHRIDPCDERQNASRWVGRKRARDQALYDDEAVVPPRPVQLV